MPKYKLVCFDVDGTLIDFPPNTLKFSWQIFHNYFDTDLETREKAKKAFFDGNISYLEWAEHDIGMWRKKGAKKEEFLKALDNLKLMDGAMETLQELKKNNMKLAIISGSMNILLEKFIPNYNEIFDDVFLSKILFDEEGNIVKIEPTEFDMIRKADALKHIAEREKIKLEECVFIGDYLNDVKVVEEAGLGIAFNTQEDELKKVADVVIEKKDLREVLKYIL